MKEQRIPTLFEILKENSDMTYNEAAKIQEDLRLKREVGACITAGMKRDKDATDKMKNRPLTDTMDERAYYELKNENERLKKRVYEAEGELSIVKGIGINSPEMKKAKERVKELENSLAIALEINDKHQRYNGKLQTRLTDVEEDNKKLAHQVEDLKLNHLRKSGL